MMTSIATGPQGGGRVRRIGLAVAVLGACAATPASAFDFSTEWFEGRLDTTVSHGVTVRTLRPAEDLVGVANGGTASSVNIDDGNLNYPRGVVSNTSKFVSDLDIRAGRFGFFARAVGFLDWHNRRREPARTPLTREARELVVDDLDILDFYATADLDFGDIPSTVRLGKHVLSWGESTFIQGGINVVNPVDVTRLRVPGAELREALLPVPMVSMSISPTFNTAFEAFYQFDWDKTDIDPPGTFFSTEDFVGPGGRKAMLGFGQIPDQGFGFGPITLAVNADLLAAGLRPQPAFDSDFLGVLRDPDRNPPDSGQFGVAMRLFLPRLNDTELGFYFVNYHSRLPIISARTGTAAGVAEALRSAGTIARPGSTTQLAATGAALAQGLPPAQAAAVGAATARTIAGTVAVDRYARTAGYIVEYPRDIQLFGASFNAQIGTTGWALQGEYSLHRGQPLQVDDVELLFATLTPIAAAQPAFLQNQLGAFGPEQTIRGYIRRNVSQIQLTATRAFGPTLGSDTALLVAEAALSHVHNMPSKGRLRLNAPGTHTSGNPFHAGPTGAHAGLPAEPSKRFADATSFGYRIAARLDYTNVIGAINLSPRLQWQHDVSGNSPGPAGNFLKGRKAVSLGLTATYLNDWEADVSWTTFLGGGRYNLLRDRDFISASLKYSF